MDTTWECIVVGAGAAGLSAALVLGRARRRTLVVDAGRQSNLVAHGIGGLLGHGDRAPADFYATGREQIAAHATVELRHGEVVSGGQEEGGFVLELGDGSRETARRVLLAIGVGYRYPELPGIEERWGHSVFHCPFCHGWEVRDRPLGVLDQGGGTGVHQAILLRAWSDDVTLLSDGPAELDADEAARLGAAGVGVDERPVAGLVGPHRTLAAVEFADGGERPLGGLLVPVVRAQRGTLAGQLGATTAPAGPLSSGIVQVDPTTFATSVPGLYAAGDIGTNMPSVANAVAAGASAAAMMIHGLMTEAGELASTGRGAEDDDVDRRRRAEQRPGSSA
ncbi:MAG: NAD(P)/FAD-dependent oxidoreductase [Solirubrobacteraceae bacterium]|nr:NAD(P)/FAD-dependent oxidoreductase [Solirubrobacteraceae bacterium]